MSKKPNKNKKQKKAVAVNASKIDANIGSKSAYASSSAHSSNYASSSSYDENSYSGGKYPLEDSPREQSGFKKYVSAVVITLVLMAMVAWVALDIIFGKDDFVAKVDGKVITREQFYRAIDVKKRRSSERQIKNKTEFEASVLRSMIMDILVDRQMNADKFIVTDADVSAIVRSEGMFSDGGVFNRNAFNEYLLQAGITEDDFIKSRKRIIYLEATDPAFQVESYGSPEIVDVLLASRNQERVFDLFVIDPVKNNPAKPTQEQLDEVYDDNVMKFQYPSVKTIKYIDSDAVHVKQNISNDEIMSFYKSIVGDGESRNVYLLAFNSQEDADRAMNFLKKSPKNKKSFESAASAFGYKDAQVLFPNVHKQDLSESISDAIFNAKRGKILPVMQSGDKFVISMVESVNSGDDKIDDNVKNIIKQKISSSRRCEEVAKLRGEVRDKIIAAESLDEIAASVNSKVLTANVKEGVFNNAVDSIVMNDLFGNGDASEEYSNDEEIINISENIQACRFVAYYVSGGKAGGIHTKDEVVDELTKMWKAAVVKDATLDKANNVAEKLKKMSSRIVEFEDSIALSDGAKLYRDKSVIRMNQMKNVSDTVDVNLVSDLFMANVNEVVGPFANSNGTYSVAVLRQVKQKNTTADKKADLETFEGASEDLIQQRNEDFIALKNQYLYGKYKVDVSEDYQYLFKKD